LKNPFYAGAYAYGKSQKRTQIVDGRARKGIVTPGLAASFVAR